MFVLGREADDRSCVKNLPGMTPRPNTTLKLFMRVCPHHDCDSFSSGRLSLSRWETAGEVCGKMLSKLAILLSKEIL